MSKTRILICIVAVAVLFCAIITVVVVLFDNRPIRISLTHNGTPITSLAFSPRGDILASAGRDQSVQLWKVSKRETTRIGGYGHFFGRIVAFSKNGSMIAIGDTPRDEEFWIGDRVTVFDVPSGDRLFHFKGGDSIRAIAFSPDDLFLVAGFADGTLRVMDISHKNEVKTINGFGAGLAFSRDGRSLVTGDGVLPNKVRLLRTDGWRLVNEWNVQKNFMSIAHSPRLDVIATGSEEGCVVKKWLLPEGKHIATIPTRQAEVTGLAYSPDGEILAIGTTAHHGPREFGWQPNGDLIFCKAQTNKQIAVFKANNTGVSCLAFSPDGETVATGGFDGTIILWNVPGAGEKFRQIFE